MSCCFLLLLLLLLVLCPAAVVAAIAAAAVVVRPDELKYLVNTWYSTVCTRTQSSTAVLLL